MKPARLFQLSFQNIWRRKFRTVLTVLGMSVGIGAMVLLISFAAGLQKANKEMLLSSMELTQLTVMKNSPQNGPGLVVEGDASSSFSVDELKTLTDIPHVKIAYPSYTLYDLKLSYNGATNEQMLTPTPVEIIDQKKKDKLEAGAWWTENDATAVVLSQQTADNLKVSPSDLVGKTVTLQLLKWSMQGQSEVVKEYSATVTGVLKKSTNSFGPFGADAISLGFAEVINNDRPAGEGYDPKLESWSTVNVIVDEPDNVKSVREEIQKKGWYASGVEELINQLNQGFLIMKIVLGIIGGIGLVVALIGITNSMLMAVLERTREIGILAALGASRRTITWLFLIEAAWLGLLGAAVGLGGAFVLGKLIVAGVGTYFSATGKDPGETTTFLKFYISAGLALSTLAGAFVITLLAGWLPARRAARLDPVKALRHE